MAEQHTEISFALSNAVSVQYIHMFFLYALQWMSLTWLPHFMVNFHLVPSVLFMPGWTICG